LLDSELAKRAGDPCEAAALGLGCAELVKPVEFATMVGSLPGMRLDSWFAFCVLGPSVKDGTLDEVEAFELALVDSGSKLGLKVADGLRVADALAAAGLGVGATDALESARVDFFSSFAED